MDTFISYNLAKNNNASLILEPKIISYFRYSVFVIGLIGNCINLILFLKKEFRNNLSHIYLLCLSLIDSLFLIACIISIELNLSYEILCKLIHFSSYMMQFTSSIIILVFTVQRVYIIYMPVSVKYKTKTSAWRSVLIILVFAFILNLWTFLVFEIKSDSDKCSVNTKLENEYIWINLIFSLVTILMPIVIIFILNIIIICKLVIDHVKMKKIKRNNNRKIEKNPKIANQPSSIEIEQFELKPHYLTFDQIIHKKTKNLNHYSKKITILMLIISFTFIALNLPYLITAILVYQNEFLKTQLILALKITEIVYYLNYGIKFYIYLLCFVIFRSNLEYSGKNNYLIFFLL
jgi:hypothetical protein